MKGVSVAFQRGERVSLLGPSGSGKSTFLKLAATILKPSNGMIRINQLNPNLLSPKKLRQLRTHIGNVYQSFDLINGLNVVNNINSGRLGQWSTAKAIFSLFFPLSIKSATSILNELGLFNIEQKLVRDLSGGQQQRVALAKIMAQDPKYIFADEPVSQLDQMNCDLVMSILKGNNSLRFEKSELLITAMHNVELALKYHDRIIGMKNGAIEFDLPAKEVTPSIIQNLYEN